MDSLESETLQELQSKFMYSKHGTFTHGVLTQTAPHSLWFMVMQHDEHSSNTVYRCSVCVCDTQLSTCNMMSIAAIQ